MKKLFYLKTLFTFATRSLKDYSTFIMWMKGQNISFCRQSKTKKRYLDSHILLGYSLLGRLLMLINLPVKIINQCRDKGQLKILADFIFIKTLYKNSCIYNGTFSNLSRKTGFSRTKITKLLTIFKKNGWVRQHANNLVFAWDKSKYSVFTTIKFITPNDIINQLNLFLLHNKQSQCMYASKMRKDLNPSGYISLKDYKKAVKFGRDNYYRGAICENFVLSAKGAGRVFNCSSATANRVLLTLEQQGLISINRVKRFVQKCSKELFKYFTPPKNSQGTFYWFKGRIYNSLPNSINIPIPNSEIVHFKIKQAA